MQNTIEQQIALEEEAVGLGIARYNRIRDRGETEVPPGQRLVKNSIVPMSALVAAWVDNATSGRPGRNAGIGAYLSQVDATTAAYVTARVIVRGICGQQRLQSVALAIANLIEDTINHDRMKEACAEQDKARKAEGLKPQRLYQRLQEKIAKSSHQGYRHIIMKRQAKYAGVATVTWGLPEKVRLGVTLVDLFAEATGLIEVTRLGRGTKADRRVIVATEATLKWLEESNNRSALLSPLYPPMVVPPVPWTTPTDGGYITRPLRLSLLKTRNKNYLSDMRDHQMPEVYAAVNTLQATAWRINRRVLGVMAAVWDGGGDVGKLPSRSNVEIPPMPCSKEEDEAKHTAWRREAAQQHEENLRARSKRFGFMQKLRVAEEYAPCERIYFPHQLDWRGRAYPVSHYLNPQLDDSGKALLHFADTKPLGEYGAYYLAVHGANCAGVDKVSFDERVQWVQDNHAQIIECATNPLDGSRYWATVDSPYQFLAFCCEWLALAVWSEDHPSAEFESRLPVSWDGSCNGLQNYSMMLRDHIGGAATNLVPSDVPSDIYAEVARAAQALVDADAANGNAVAALWAGKVSRKIAKRPTMTLPYGATVYGYKDQLLATLKKQEEEEGVVLIPKEHKFAACVYLSERLSVAIGSVVVAAKQAMDWLQEVAIIVASDGLPVQWVAPNGLLVLQDYRTMTGQVVNSQVGGERVQLMIEIEGSTINKRKQGSGIAPNFIHSLDASHMMRTVNYGREEGIDAFSMIHDSFGTHAGKAQCLMDTLRRAFVDQYTDDVLGGFRGQLIAKLPPALGEKLPPVPPFGRLEVADVLSSDYFFA